jgi:hypothetical protein
MALHHCSACLPARGPTVRAEHRGLSIRARRAILVTSPLITPHPSSAKSRVLVSDVLSTLRLEYLDAERRIRSSFSGDAAPAVAATPRWKMPTDRRRNAVQRDLLEPRSGRQRNGAQDSHRWFVNHGARIDAEASPPPKRDAIDAAASVGGAIARLTSGSSAVISPGKPFDKSSLEYSKS